MISSDAKRKIPSWLPAALCAFISFIALCTILCVAFINHKCGGNEVLSGLISFLCFLPMCFSLVGAGMSQMQKEIVELRKQIEELKSK